MPDKPLGILPGKVDEYKPQPEPKPTPKPRPIEGKAGKLKTRTYTTPSITTIDKLQDRRRRSK